MTFGRTLQELTRLCGVKRCNLADALGYDPSYISRWINGVKRPSLRSNDALPAQIAAYLTANAAPDVRARIAGQFDLRCDAADDAGFSAALASLLADTIAAEGLVENARRVGDRLLERLRTLPALHDVRGRGLMIGFDVEGSASELRRRLVFEQHVFTGGAGAHTVRLLPALGLSEAQADEFVARLKALLEDFH